MLGPIYFIDTNSVTNQTQVHSEVLTNERTVQTLNIYNVGYEALTYCTYGSYLYTRNYIEINVKLGGRERSNV